MADPTPASPDEKRAVIEEHLASLKQAVFTEGYCYSRTFDEEHLKTIERQRRSIEALEYALSVGPTGGTIAMLLSKKNRG